MEKLLNFKARTILNEPKCDIVAELIIPKKYFQMFELGMTIEVMRRLVTQNTLMSFCEYGVKSQSGDSLPDGIVVDQLCISENGRS